jgi:hypothetical protein
MNESLHEWSSALVPYVPARRRCVFVPTVINGATMLAVPLCPVIRDDDEQRQAPSLSLDEGPKTVSIELDDRRLHSALGGYPSDEPRREGGTRVRRSTLRSSYEEN